jgi:CubicO group peptidase (beta-lactamase class C family)
MSIHPLQWTICVLAFFAGTVSAAAQTSRELHFPSTDSTWESVTPESLGWNVAALEDACRFVENTNGKSFLILQNGRIAVERYWTEAGVRHSQYIMSSGKSITAFLVGIAVEQKKLQLDQPASEFLGVGWSKATPAQERAIQIRHLLQMTSGLNPQLEYEGPPGTIWRYNTDAYQQLHPLLEKAVGTSMQEFSKRTLFEPMGMANSMFRFHSFVMNARDMGRFGLVIQAQGTWDGRPIMQDREFFDAMLNSSQTLNRAYGYLWWLNGRESFRVVGAQRAAQRGPRPGPLVPAAPQDMVSANGRGGQRIYVVPSLGLVVVRLGENPAVRLRGVQAAEADGTQSKFDNQLWEKLMAAIQPNPGR